MPAKQKRKQRKMAALVLQAVAGHARANAAVESFLAGLKHPLKKEIAAVREIILATDRSIGEGIKWNAPSFCTTEYFATVNLRSRDAVQLILHLGAKVRDNTREISLRDPAGLVKWLAKDRCMVTLGAGRDIAAHRAAFQSIVREWIRFV